MLTSLVSLTQYLSTYGYIALYLIVFIGGTYLPIPGGLVVIAVGALARAGYFNLYFAFLVSLLASVSSDLLPFWLARKFGKKASFRRYIEKHKYARHIEEYMRKYPKSTILASRFIGLASMPVNIVSGLSQIKALTFLLMDLLGNIICTSIYIGVGYLVGIAAIHGTHFTTLVAIVLGGMAIVYVASFLIVRNLRDV